MSAARDFFEPRFGYDFSGVRVHTDARAAEAAKEVDARAFTVGRDVVFGKGEYAPGTSAGIRLVAHELAHVIQQDAAAIVAHKDHNIYAVNEARIAADHIMDGPLYVPKSQKLVVPAIQVATTGMSSSAGKTRFWRFLAVRAAVRTDTDRAASRWATQ